MLDLSPNRWDVGAPSKPRGDRLIFIGATPTDSLHRNRTSSLCAPQAVLR